MVLRRRTFIVSSAALLLFLLVLAVPAFAQFGEAKGGLFGKVVDDPGGVSLPGATVTLSGCGSPVTQVSNVAGEFRFLNLAPCTYELRVELTGFTTVRQTGVVVQVGINTQVTIAMKLSAVASTVTVTGEAPLLDTRKVESGAVATQKELASIPTGRDPWVVLQSVPGVLLDRVNMAGSESGQQSNFMSKGATGGTFVLDGVNMTDASAAGASAGYFDFGSFQEIQINTGGSDITLQGSGAHLNMVTKRGTNEVHGTLYDYVVNDRFESSNAGTGTPGARSIYSIQNYGLEAGGPLWKDHLWLWGSYGRNDIQIRTGTSTVPNSKFLLENISGKLNAQVVPENSFTLWGERKDKIAFGRGAGAGRDQSATNDQTTPQNSFKIDDSHIFSANFFASVKLAAITKGDFTLDPESGPNVQAYFDPDGNWHGGGYTLISDRRNRAWVADASYFLNTGPVGHELKAGFQYSYAIGSSTSGWTGAAINGQAAQTFGTYACGEPCAAIIRTNPYRSDTRYYSAYLQDTVTWDRLTVNAGVRWDRQYGFNSPSTAPANISFPQILPALVYNGQDKQFTWNDWSPRVGITYALGEKRETLLKASYARFVEPLGTGLITRTNPAGVEAYAYYPWNDANHDNIVQVSEVNLAGGPLGNSFGYNASDPGNPGVPGNLMDPNLKSPQTDEFIVGVEHELIPDLSIGFAYSYRKYNRLFTLQPYDVGTGRILTNADYVPGETLTGTLPDGTAYTDQVYNVNPAVLATLTNGGFPTGNYTTNSPDYKWTYNGFDFTVTKRLSNKWMARANFNYNTFKQSGCNGGGYGPQGPRGVNEPNNGTQSSSQYGYVGGSCRDGDYVNVQSAASGTNKSSVFLNSRWVYNINALYELPYNFNISTAIFGREGYPVNWYQRTTGSVDGVSRDIGVVPTNSQRYSSFFNWDLRLDNAIRVTQGVTLTIAAECFNVTNKATILQVFNRLGASNENHIREVQGPRTWRFSARLSF